GQPSRAYEVPSGDHLHRLGPGEPPSGPDDGKLLVAHPVERKREVLWVEEDLELALRERPHPEQDLAGRDLVPIGLAEDRDPERERTATDVPHAGEREVAALRGLGP